MHRSFVVYIWTKATQTTDYIAHDRKKNGLWAQWQYLIQISNVKDAIKTVIQRSDFLVTTDVVQKTHTPTHSLT